MPAHALWHRDPDNETVTPGCDEVDLIRQERCQAKLFANRSSVALIPSQIASTVLFRVENCARRRPLRVPNPTGQHRPSARGKTVFIGAKGFHVRVQPFAALKSCCPKV